jgi:hypothetical protein
MNPIHRTRRLLARPAGPPGVVERPASKLPGPAGRRPGRSGRDGVAGRFIQDVAAAASVAAGHQLGWPSHGPPPAAGRRWAARPPSTVPSAAPEGQNRPAPATTTRLAPVPVQPQRPARQ